MSWLSDLADRAETLLNKIDQNAAAVLQEKDKKIQLVEEPKSSENSPEIEISVAQSNENVSLDKLTRLASHESSARKSKQKLLKKQKESPMKTKLLNGSMKHSSSFSGGFSDNKNTDLEPPHSSVQLNNFILGDDSIDEVSINNTEVVIDQKDNDECEKYSIENDMLKNEISVVHNELSLLLSKTKNAEKVTQDTQARFVQMENAYNQLVKENVHLHNQVSLYEEQLHKQHTNEEFNEIKGWESEKVSLEERINELEFTVNTLTSLKKDLEADIKSSQDMCMDLEEKLEKAKVETANTLAEWKNYKIRVNNTLAMKEKMIETLGGNQELGENETIPILNTQITHLKEERDEAVEELVNLKTEFENKCRQIDGLELNLRTAERQVSQLKDSLRQEKSSKDIAENTVNSLSKELQTLQTETAKQISSLRNKLREQKPIGMEKQLSELKSSFGTSESGEDRFRSLTQALVAKQAALESVTIDRNALRMQLEKTENKYRSDLVSMKNNQPRIINFNYTDDVKEQFPSLLRESPWDSKISRKVKKAYSSLDSFSVRIGVFLRRNPIARIFIIAYMIILHLWVLIVLCTYTPEVHSK